MNAHTMISSCKEDEASEDKDSSGVPKGVLLIRAAVIEEDRTGERNQIWPSNRGLEEEVPREMPNGLEAIGNFFAYSKSHKLNNEQGDIIEKASTVSRKSLLAETELDVRRENPVQNKFLASVVASHLKTFLRSGRYFNRPDCKVYRKKRQRFKKKKRKPCYICADWGHNGKFCPLVNTCFVCSKKESKNDEEEDRTSMFCLKCGSTGHGIFSCTNDYDPEDLKGIQCYICLDFGHLCCTENSTEGPSEASCYNCGQSGHHGFECTKNKMNAVAKYLQPVSVCFKCQKRVHYLQTGDLDNKLTLAKTIMSGKDEVLDKSIEEKSRKTQTGELDNKLTLLETTTAGKYFVPNNPIKGKSQKAQTGELDNKSTSVETTTLGKDAMLDKSVKEKSRKAEAGEMDDKATLAETTMAGKDVVWNNFVKRKSRPTQLGELDNKLTSTETTTLGKDAVPDKSINGKSRKARRRERKRKRKPVTPTSNVIQSLPTIRKPVMPTSNVNCVIQSLPTVSMIGYTIPRYGQCYGNPGSNAWLSPPEAAARNFVNTPALNQSSYGKPVSNVWLSPPAAAARNCLGNSPAVNRSSYQPGVHFFHHNTNYREATHVPPTPFRPCSFPPHGIFHQGTPIPGPPQNRVQLPHQNFTHQMRTHVPQSTFDSRMPISQQPELPLLAPNHRIGAFLPYQKLQHQLSSHQTWMAPPGYQLSSHQTWMAPPGWKPYH